MEYSKLVSVTGLSGLFELVASKNDGAIVRSLDDKSTRFVSSRKHNFSHLESIEVYTEGDNVNLVDVFKAMQDSQETLPSEKDPAAVKAYFKTVYPEMDFDRVYGSDMKKMIKWFDVLKRNEVEIKLTEPAGEDDDIENNNEIPQEEPEKEPEVEEPAKKPAVKAKAAKAKKETAVTGKEEESTDTETKAAKKKSTKK